MKSTILELLIIAAAGLALGATSNAVRHSGSLDPFKAYLGTIESPNAPGGGTKAADGGSDDGSEQGGRLYQLITVDEVADIVGDPDLMDSGLFVVVDARKESEYEEGHIAGAIRCYHYELEGCIDRVVEAAAGVEKVIVYCNGGECSDSKYMCHELIDNFGVPYDSVYLFASGWEAWIDNEMPYDQGLE